MLTINEMEILKSALEGDITRQKEYLDELANKMVVMLGLKCGSMNHNAC